MKRLAILLGLVVFGFTGSAFAKPKQCKTVLDAGVRSNFIYKHSAPLRTGGVGTPLRGFRVEPTLIMNKPFGRGGTSIYCENGTKIGSCPWASAHGHAGGRFRCTMNTRSLIRTAKQKCGSPAGYFQLSGNRCARVANMGVCYGSVKGDCTKRLS